MREAVSKSGDAADDNWPAVGLARQTLDEREVIVRAFAPHLDVDPIASSADMGVAQAMIRGGIEALTARIGLLAVREESEEEVCGLARLRGGADDGAIVLAQHLEPGADVVGVAHRRHDAERRATKRGVHLGDLS